MVALMNFSSCSCTTTCCTCSNTFDNYAPSTHSKLEPVARFIWGAFKTWCIWVSWKLELPSIIDLLSPAFDLLPQVLRPRTRERRHVQGHSPRRVQ